MSKTGGLQQRKQAFLRGEIWNAALDLFVARGYEATTVEEIAEAAGVSRRTFFRYFASKDDLMVKAIDTYGDLLSQAIRNAPPGMTSLETVKYLVSGVAKVVIGQPRVRETMAVTVSSAGARRAQLLELAVVEERIAAEFARQRGGRGIHSARLMASFTVVLLSQTFRVWHDHHSEGIDEAVGQVLESLTDLLNTNRRPHAVTKRVTRTRPRRPVARAPGA